MGTWARWLEQHPEPDLAVAVIGAGFIGRGAVHRLRRAQGMRPALVVSRRLAQGVEAFVQAGFERDAVTATEDPREAAQAAAARRPVATSAVSAVEELDAIDLVIEATGALDYGAATVVRALRAGRGVISFNAELDATVGFALRHTAATHGATYSIADGDQPGVLLRQLEHVDALGFSPIAAVNCKRNLDVYQNPDDSAPYARRDGTSVHMTTAFGDGTKMQIENAVVANLSGLRPDQRGMHGVQTTLADAAHDIPEVLGSEGVVEYTLGGDFGGGVLVVARPHDEVFTKPYMQYAKMGAGPAYTFFRPYHLLHHELPLTIAQVAMDERALGQSQPAPVAEVVAMAKRELSPGDVLDGIGGFCCYGLIDTVERAASYLPIGLADHARVMRRVQRDEPVPRDAVELDAQGPMIELRALHEDIDPSPPDS